MTLSTPLETGPLRTLRSIASHGSNSGVCGGLSMSGNTTAQANKQGLALLTVPNLAFTALRRANMPSRACINGLLFSSFRTPNLSIVSHVPFVQLTLPPFISKHTTPPEGTSTTKSISPYGPPFRFDKPRECNTNHSLVSGSDSRRWKTRFSAALTVLWSYCGGIILAIEVCASYSVLSSQRSRFTCERLCEDGDRSSS